jgi:hypothetical protein
MNTTTILIENVIQGLQTFVWIALVTLSFEHPELDLHLYKDYLAPVSFLALASFYWLGIVVDTMYYNLFIQRHEARWVKAMLHDDDPALLTMVCKCILASSDLAKLLLERQAHLRLLRVSLVNSAFLTLASVLFLHLGLSHHSVWLTLGVAGIGGTAFVGIAYTWRSLYKYYVTMVQTSYVLITATSQVRLRS